MPQPPEMLKGIIFNEPFFDSVVKRAGGHRLTDRHVPPPGVKNVDYFVGDFGLELKILTADPLAARERQARIARFLHEELPRGPLWVTAHRRAISLAGPVAQDYWQRILGRPIEDRLDSAAEQIRDTRTFVPGNWRGGVLIVNAAAPTFDWLSFSHLAGFYQRRFPEIDAVFAINAVPFLVAGQFQLHLAAIGKDGLTPEAHLLWGILDRAIRDEITARTGRAIGSVELDPRASPGRSAFRLTPSGIEKKEPVYPV